MLTLIRIVLIWLKCTENKYKIQNMFNKFGFVNTADVWHRFRECD